MKYDWSEIPEHIMWIATDANGEVYGYIEKPKPNKKIWVHSGYCDYLYTANPTAAWQDSLEARP